MRTARAIGAVAALLLLGTAAPLAAAPDCDGRQSVQRGSTGTWTTYALPDFAAGPAEVTAHAMDRLDPSRWWATNGIALARSTDGGCSWRGVFTLPQVPTAEVPASRLTDRIDVLAVPDGSATVLLSVDLGEDSPALGIVTVDDGDAEDDGGSTVVLAGGDQFRALAPLAAPAGAPGPLVVAPSDARTIYAVAGGIVNASRDGGASWRIASPAAQPVRGGVNGFSFSSDEALPGVRRLAVDPLDAQSVWATEHGRLSFSRDGGSGYETVLDVGSEGELPLLAVARPRGGPARVTVGDQDEDGAALRSLRISDGQGLVARPTTASGIGLVTGKGQSMAAGPRRTDLVLTTEGAAGPLHGVYAYLPGTDRLVAVDEFRRGPLLDVQATGQGRPQYAFRASRSMVRWVPDLRLPAPAPPPAPLPEFPAAPAGGLAPLSDATRVLGPASVRIAPGQRRVVPLALELAPEPTPLDVFFLLDTSGSMNDVIDGLAEGFADLADELAAAGIDARYGLADYQDTGGVRYRRLVDLSPADGPLREALEAIQTAGGAEPAYTALHQIATGSGVEAPSRGLPVPPGAGASWRAGSLRVVVHATDEVPTEDPDGADRDTAVAALRADGARHVGIEVVRNVLRQVSDSELAPPGQLNDILRGLSRDTGALAPAGGIDCDDDGEADIPAGEPLVCELLPGGGRLELAGPLQRVLSSLVDEQDVGVAVGPAASVAGLQGELLRTSGRPRVDVKRAHRQEYSLGLTCPVELAGTSRDLRLRPTVGVRVGQATTMQVVCDPVPAVPGRAPGTLPEPDLLPPLPPAPALLVPALPTVPPPPPAPVNAPAPAGAPAAVPAPAAAPAPGVALAPADEQVELALVQQDSEEQLAMVDRRAGPDPLAMRLLAVSLICAVATRTAMQRLPAVRRTD